jgi:CheY-like chemotaxis protein
METVERNRVLYVDDSPAQAAYYREQLERFGMEVAVAGAVADALNELSWARPEVIVSAMLLMVDGRYGCALIWALRQRFDSEGRTVPVVALTRWARDCDRTRILALGFDEHRALPCAPITLAAAIRDLLRDGGISRAANGRNESGVVAGGVAARDARVAARNSATATGAAHLPRHTSCAQYSGRGKADPANPPPGS